MNIISRNISLSLPQGKLLGHLNRPEYARTLILMLQTSMHPAYSKVSLALSAHNHAILAIDLLTAHEANFPDQQQNAPMLAQRLLQVIDFLRRDGDTQDLLYGLYATDHTVPAAIRAATQRDLDIRAIVASGGIIDHAGRQYLEALAAPLLVLVDPEDTITQGATQRAFAHLNAPHAMHPVELHAVPPETVAWFAQWLR